MIKQEGLNPLTITGSLLETLRSAQAYEKTFEQADLRFARRGQEPLCPKGLCVLLGEFGASTNAIMDWARTVGATLMIINQQPLPMGWLIRYAPHLDFLMVDGDYLDDTERTIDFCMQVRRTSPSLPLILLSSEVRAHDLTCERMMACDVTLKNPVQGHALSSGIQVAYQNHAYYLSERC